MKTNFDLVDSTFKDAVIDKAEEKGVDPSEISLILFPEKQTGNRYATRVRLFSKTKAFEDEVMRLKKITIFDMVGSPISRAIMKIFEFERDEHNGLLKEYQSAKNAKHISYEATYNDQSQIVSELDKWCSEVLNTKKFMTVKNIPHPIDLEKFECYIEVEKGDNNEWISKMNMIHDHRFLKPYNVKEEFQNIEVE